MTNFEPQCRHIAKQVGMSCVIVKGVDPEIVRLAETVGYSLSDIGKYPSQVAEAITAYLDDLVRNP